MAKLVSEIALLQKEEAVQDSIVDVNYNTARKIQKEVENFYYDMITRRMSAEAAKEQAAAMVDKKAIELWKQEALNTKYLDKTQEERVTKLVSEIALLQKEGAVQDSIVDVNYKRAGS